MKLFLVLILLSSAYVFSAWKWGGLKNSISKKLEIQAQFEKKALILARRNRLLEKEISDLKYKISKLESERKYLSVQHEIKKQLKDQVPERGIASIPKIETVDLVNFDVYKWTPEKLLAQGKALAKVTLETLNDSSLKVYSSLDLGIRARSISLAMDNSLFQLAAFVGIFDRGFVGWKKIRSEISAWKLGPATFVHVPGELYPEILHGGIESPNGADFKIDPVEVPALKEKIPGQYIFFSGMSNDMIGYIVPKSQWDVNPPFSYDYQDRPYGEINSLGPETAPKIHGEVLSILKDLQLLKK